MHCLAVVKDNFRLSHRARKTGKKLNWLIAGLFQAYSKNKPSNLF